MSTPAPGAPVVDLELAVERADEVPAAEVPPDADLERWARAALAGQRTEAQVALRIVGADEGRELNARWRGREDPTNVLSFPADLPEDLGIPLLGDLVVCAPVVARQAAEQGKPVSDHWAHMVVHGILHLLGHDHAREDEAEAMEALERRILGGLGIADPYA